MVAYYVVSVLCLIGRGSNLEQRMLLTVAGTLQYSSPSGRTTEDKKTLSNLASLQNIFFIFCTNVTRYNETSRNGFNSLQTDGNLLTYNIDKLRTQNLQGTSFFSKIAF